MNTKIIGCGNPLAGDDGVGLRAIQELGKLDLPPNIEILEAGTPGLALLDLMEGAERVVIVDAISSGSSPGTIHRLTQADLLQTKHPSLSLHDLDLSAALELGRRAQPESMPREIIILGIEIEQAQPFRPGLSRLVEEALPKLVEAILQEVKNA